MGKKKRKEERNAVIPMPLGGVDNFWPYANVNGGIYPLDSLTLTMPGSREEEIESNFESYVSRAYKSNSVVFACMLARLMVFSEARFQFRQLRKGRPGDLFGTPALDILERPFGPNSTTGDLLARVITDADAAGNFYATRRNDRIVRMRPDWVTMVHGTKDPNASANSLDATFLGIIYYEGGEFSGGEREFIQRADLAHFAPIPDPTARSRGMSWFTPIVREIMGDGAMTAHKLKFHENAGTPNLIVKMAANPAKEAFEEWREMIEAGHRGLANAYRTMYLTNGADATVVGKDLRELDFKIVQGAGETRIAAASGIHPVVVGLSEGMQGASLNAGNFNSARRLTADKTFRPLWRNLAGSLQTLVSAPPGSQLWYDDRDIAFLLEDRKDRAEIQQMEASTMRQLYDGGWLPESIVKAVEAYDWTLLEHSGLPSVQNQPGTVPVEVVPPKPTNGTTKTPKEAPA